MEPLKVFCSYAHEDGDLCEELKKHLSPLRHAGIIADWYDRMISPGAEWESQIDHHLKSAQIIILLVSADFMAYKYCWGVEMQRAMERQEKGEARVVPVITAALLLAKCALQQTPVSSRPGPAGD